MLVILDTHPVQYRVPVYQELERFRPGRFRVLYASDCSAAGYHDAGFGITVKWKQPLLECYPHEVLHCETNGVLDGYRSLGGQEVRKRLRELRPTAVLFSGFEYEFYMSAYANCLVQRIPVWVRQETQDEAFERRPLKSVLRHCYYRALYAPVRHAFFIGELNRRHYQRHGLGPKRMSRSPYCVPNPLSRLGTFERTEARLGIRRELGIDARKKVVCFSGKFIPKKDPVLLIEAAARLSPAAASNLVLMFIGCGELESELHQRSKAAGLRAVFTGFINQDRLPFFYLAADVFVLPSRRLGETWGLVVNEALHAGCAVIVSEAVGCSAEFGNWERCRVISPGDSAACAQAIDELSRIPRSFDWAATRMAAYSVEAAAQAIAARMK